MGNFNMLIVSAPDLRDAAMALRQGIMLVVLLSAVTVAFGSTERQLTSVPHGHMLTNLNVWSPDGQWIVYDVRTGDAFDGALIEQVNVRTGEVQRLYKSTNEAKCGVVTYSPTERRVVFIHGPENPSVEWTYGFTRRRGALVDLNQPGISRPLDAMNYAPPFTTGALRGGSHVHMFSPDGCWISYTYEDELLARLDSGPNAVAHEPNQRNVGVSTPVGPVCVNRNHPRNHDGDWFSVLVTRTVASPVPGSDDISRAFEEGWVGQEGYTRTDGSRQPRALAFQGLVSAFGGRQHAEVYIVDLPEDLTKEGTQPLAGSATTRPAPPRGVQQRRLTFTADRKHPGVVSSPRHWLRASPDGSQIAFLMRDDAGVAQLWTVSPNGGQPRQITRNEADIASAFTWSPDGRSIAHMMHGSVCLTEVSTGRTVRLTTPREAAGELQPQACVFSPDGRFIAYTRNVTQPVGTFAQIFMVEVIAGAGPR